jgi:hypothetical protein
MEWALSFRLMENAAKNCNPLIFELAEVDEELDRKEPFEAIKKVCIAFTKIGYKKALNL